MGKMQKTKGYEREREFANAIGGRRIPLSGAMRRAAEGLAGDVEALGLRWEVKARKSGFKALYDWLQPDYVDALAIRADGKQWLVVQTLDQFMAQRGFRKYAVSYRSGKKTRREIFYAKDDSEAERIASERHGDKPGFEIIPMHGREKR